MKKIVISVLLCFMFLPNLNAIDYKIDDYITDASIDISGNLLIKEVIKMSGTYNGYVREIKYKNDKLDKFTGKKSDFYGSDIYNSSGIELYKVGKIDWKGDLNFEVFDKEVTLFNECTDESNCYTKEDNNDTFSITMYNKTNNNSTYFYIEYLLANTVVIHEDVAELYYNFIGSDFTDKIGNYQLRLVLPMQTKEEIKIWAHGPLNGEVSILKNSDGIYGGGYLHINNIPNNTPLDMRMTFPKDLIVVDHPFLKKSNVKALPYILEVEEKRSKDANNQRKFNRLLLSISYGSCISYILITIILFIYIYIKYDKEYKSSFTNQYNREFIDDYDVVIVEYIMDKDITEKSFSTSILNMIYKKNISFTKNGKNDYIFKKENTNNLNESEQIIVKLIFDEIGDTKKVSLNEIKKYSKKIINEKSPFVDRYNDWRSSVLNTAESLDFYINNTSKKLFLSLYAIIGFILTFFNIFIGVFNILSVLVLIFAVLYIIYLVNLKKRTVKGNEHYVRWKAFKNFLLDFGKFDEKDLPDIKLWERYLVYANIFGIADKLSKLMKIKISEINPNIDVFDYIMFYNLNTNFNNIVTNSINNVNISTINSSGKGFGGGFSSGGGFGGGGGGGHGF